MSTSTSTHELSCPNCGASYQLPVGGNQVECAYCGSRFLVPESVRTNSPTVMGWSQSSVTPTQINASNWVRWLVIIIVVTTVVPLACSLVGILCGVLAPLLTFFVR